MRLVLFLCCISLLACQKEALQHQADIQLIHQYLVDSNITAYEDSDANYFYNIYLESGDSIRPVQNIGLKVKVKYKAYLLDGTIIQDTGNASIIIDLDQAIYGWQLAMPKMAIGDKMLLFLPSRLAYGPEGNAQVPPNTVLLFDIELIDVYPHF